MSTAAKATIAITTGAVQAQKKVQKLELAISHKVKPTGAFLTHRAPLNTDIPMEDGALHAWVDGRGLAKWGAEMRGEVE